MLGNWEKSDTMLSAIDRHTVHQVTCLLNITHKTEKASTTSVIWCVVLFPFTHFSFLCSYWTPCYGCAKLVVTLRQSEEVFYQCRKGMLNACNNHKFSFIVAMLVLMVGWLNWKASETSDTTKWEWWHSFIADWASPQCDWNEHY